MAKNAKGTKDAKDAKKRKSVLLSLVLFAFFAFFAIKKEPSKFSYPSSNARARNSSSNFKVSPFCSLTMSSWYFSSTPSVS